MSNKNSGFLSYHGPALVIFALLATVFLWDVLLLGYSLGAFDIILNQPSWKGEFPVFGIDQPILSDSPTAHFPQREFEWGHAALLKNVELNTYMFTGVPWTAQGVGAFITSLPQLFLDIPNAIDWSVWFRLTCAGFFMYLLVMELGLSRLAGIFAGILWTYSLHQIVWLEFPQHLATQLWIPLLFLFNIRLLRDGWNVFNAVALLVINVLFFTSGYMQIVLYTYVSVGLFNTFYVLTHLGRGEARRDLGRWVTVHSIYIAAVALCAAGLYAEVNSISEGLRGAQEWRGRVAAPDFSLATFVNLVKEMFPRPLEVTHMLAPNYYGGFWGGRYSFEHGNVVESSRYFGILGILFATTALFAAWRSRYIRMVAAFALVLAVVFTLLYRNDVTISALRLIPFADKGSYSRFITIGTFLGCVLAAYGFQCALGKKYKWLAAAAALIGGYVLVAWMQLDDLRITAFWYPAVIVLVVLAAVAARQYFGFQWRWAACLVVAIAAADLFGAGYGFNTRMENEKLFPRNNAIRYLLNDPEPYRVAVISDKPLYHPNILSYYDIPVVEGYLTTLPVDYVRYVKELFGEVHVTRNGIMFIFKPNVQALRLLNVKYVLSDQPLDREYDGLVRVLDTNNHSIFRIEDNLPRVFCASDVFYEKAGGEVLHRYEKVIKEYSEPIVLKGSRNSQSYSGRCEVSDLKVYTHRLSAVVDADTPRYLAVPYAYNGNWHATVDGKAVEIEKANGYHMAIRLPAGESRIAFRYRNRWSTLSGWIFVIAGLGLLIFAWRGGSSGVRRSVLSAVAIVVIFKSSLSVPAVDNDDIPERAALAEPLKVYRQGVSRTQTESYGERVTADNAVEYPLHIESKGLTRLSLLAGTFHQPWLEQTVTVRIFGEDGEVLVERDVKGRDILNNRWFTLKFPPIEKETALRVRISTRESDRTKSFVMWFDANGELCLLSAYQLNPDS